MVGDESGSEIVGRKRERFVNLVRKLKASLVEEKNHRDMKGKSNGDSVQGHSLVREVLKNTCEAIEVFREEMFQLSLRIPPPCKVNTMIPFHRSMPRKICPLLATNHPFLLSMIWPVISLL